MVQEFFSLVLYHITYGVHSMCMWCTRIGVEANYPPLYIAKVKYV